MKRIRAPLSFLGHLKCTPFYIILIVLTEFNLLKQIAVFNEKASYHFKQDT